MTSTHRPTTVGSTSLVEVAITTELDASAAPRLHTLLDEALALRPGQLVVDLADCPSLDAAAVGVLLDAHRRAWRAGGRLVLRSPSARLRRILRLARVDHVLHVMSAPAQQSPLPTGDAAPGLRSGAASSPVDGPAGRETPA